MAALIVLLAVCLALLAATAIRVPASVFGGISAAGVLAGLAGVAAPGVVHLGLVFAVDGLSAVLLVVLFLLGAVGAVAPGLLGALGLALLAGDGVGLTVALAGVVLLAGAPPLGRRWEWAAALAVCLAAAVLGLGGIDPRFSAMHLGSAGLAGVAVALAAVAAAAILAVVVPGVGGLLAVYLVGRLMLDLPGAVTPGWWGVPVLLLGVAVAVPAARRAASADDLVGAIGAGGSAVQGMALLGLGAALLARGADLVPLASLAVAAGLLLLLGWGVWGGLLMLCGRVVQAGAGGGLERLGGVLRRVPAVGLALLIGLSALAAVPGLPGFAGVWLVVQALVGAGRTGGLGVLLLVAGVVAALGLVLALLAAAAARLAGMVLLGGPRSAKAGALAAPSRGVRLGMAGLVVAALLLGAVPALGLGLVQGGVRLLTGADMQGVGWFGVGVVDTAGAAAGYAAPGLLVLAGVVLAGVGWVARGARVVGPAWQGGFAEDGVGRGNAGPFAVRMAWPDRAALGGVWGAGVVGVLGLVLAAVLGWAAR